MFTTMSIRTLSRPGCTVRYRWRPSASGRWVVFLHGAGMDGRMFEAQIPAVPSDVGILCWDARGHGASTLSGPFRYADVLADLRGLLAAERCREVVIVGQSMGGNLAQSFADEARSDLRGLVLIDCTANHGSLSRGERWALRASTWLMWGWPWRLLARQSAGVCGVEASTIAYAHACLLRLGKRRFIEVMRFWRDALNPDSDHRLGYPTLAIVGSKDRAGNISAAMSELADRDGSVRLLTVSGAGHNANMDRPDVTNAALCQFLAQVFDE